MVSTLGTDVLVAVSAMVGATSEAMVQDINIWPTPEILMQPDVGVLA